jgi:hypothetical protein
MVLIKLEFPKQLFPLAIINCMEIYSTKKLLKLLLELH